MNITDSLHGACTREQALAALGRYGLRVAIEYGRLVPVWRGVLVERTRLLDPWTRAAAACLSLGPTAVVCGPTALRLHGCSAAGSGTVHVVTPYHNRVRRHGDLRVHHGRLPDDAVIMLDGLPVTSLDLAVSEMLCLAPRRLALACADQAAGTLPAAEREAFVKQVGERLCCRADRRGTRRARALLELVDGAAESPPESSLRLVVVDAGLPIPEVQYEVCGLDGVVLWRLDMAWPSLQVALEYDGFAAHAGRAAQDAARDADLARRGWLIVRATAADLRDPTRVLDELTAAFNRRGAVSTPRRLGLAV